jgi:hypothetical protein
MKLGIQIACLIQRIGVHESRKIGSREKRKYLRNLKFEKIL